MTKKKRKPRTWTRWAIADLERDFVRLYDRRSDLPDLARFWRSQHLKYCRVRITEIVR